MFQNPEYTRNVSMRLSEVLADIGVDDKIVLKRRTAWILNEAMFTIPLLDKNESVYIFGSQSEGTTTEGLQSDTDRLSCLNAFNVIQDWSDWEPGVKNLLMIQDERVSPGYCLLQCLRDDAPLPYTDVPNEYFFRDRTGRILFRNNFASDVTFRAIGGGVRHGPANTHVSQHGCGDTDFVFALPCKSWPLQAGQWLNWQGVGQWPSGDMRRYCCNTGCFVVGVGSKGSENYELEWRLSTSLAERCLMFNLSITQIRCSVLMKMILKTYFKQYFKDTISSFMCKTVLFHCIANAHCNIWRENNLLACLSLCLCVLYTSTVNENCPHFIIPANNLMRGHISHKSIKPYILEILQCVINSEGTALLGIECDDLGSRLCWKLSNLFSFKTSDIVSGGLLTTNAYMIAFTVKHSLHFCMNSSYGEAIRTMLNYIFKLVNLSNQCRDLYKTAYCLLAPPLCTSLGSVLASLNIQQYNAISAEALTWISLGLNTDIASGKLKLASMLYYIGDTRRTEIVLRDIEGSYDPNIVEPVCCCHAFIHQPLRRGFNETCDNHYEEALQYVTAFCVRYMKCEINCVPYELQYEMFRSTQEDLAFRGRYDYWMDCAVVDSLPYLYFLQYKTYSYLGRQDDKQAALSNLVRTIDQEPNLGHRETALNLLGQCMEQENRARDALHCYLLSLNLRGRNNAAKFHICRLFSSTVNNPLV